MNDEWEKKIYGRENIRMMWEVLVVERKLLSLKKVEPVEKNEIDG